MKMCLAVRLGIFDTLLQDILGFLHELTVQVDGVGFNPSRGIVLAEDEIGCLLVVLFHHCAVSLALF